MFQYILFGVVILLAFFVFLIGINKMFQVIVSTSFIILVVLWWSGLFVYLKYYLSVHSEIMLFSFSNISLIEFLNSADTTTNILLFVGLLIYAIHYSDTHLQPSGNMFSSKLLQVALVPIAIMSMIVGLSISVVGIDLFSLWFLQQLATNFSNNTIIFNYIFFLPVALLLQGLITLLLLFPKSTETDWWYDEL